MPGTDVLGSPGESLEARVAALERNINGASTGVRLGKTKVVAGTNESQGFSWQGTSTWVTCETDIAVPQFATAVSIIAVVTTVVTINASFGAAGGSYISAQFPDLGLTQDAGANVFVQNNEQQQRTRVYTAVDEPVTGGGTLRVIGRGSAVNSGGNGDNYISIDAIATFTY